MTKRDFLEKLAQDLGQLPESERQKHIRFYEESIDDRMEDGMDEEAAVEALGNPAEAARQILEETPLPLLVKTRVEPKDGWSPMAILLAVIGSPLWLPIAIALAAVAISLYAVLWSLVAAAAATVLGMLAGSLCCMVMPFFAIAAAPGNAVLIIGLGFAGLGLAAVCAIGVFYAGKGAVKLTVRLARGIKSLFIRREQ